MRTALAAFLAAAAVIALGIGSVVWIDRVLAPHAPYLVPVGLIVAIASGAAWGITYTWLTRLFRLPDN